MHLIKGVGRGPEVGKGQGTEGKGGKTFWAPKPSENVWFSLGFLRKIKDLGCCAVIHGIQDAWIGFVAFGLILDNFGSFLDRNSMAW